MCLGALNGTLEGLGGIIGALMIGFFVLDGTRFRRRTRGFIGLACVTAMTIVIWSCALAWQVTFTRTPRAKLRYTNDGYHAKGALFFFCTSSLPVDILFLRYRTDKQTPSLLLRCLLPGSRVLDPGCDL